MFIYFLLLKCKQIITVACIYFIFNTPKCTVQVFPPASEISQRLKKNKITEKKHSNISLQIGNLFIIKFWTVMIVQNGVN